jgi:hypothetical protein
MDARAERYRKKAVQCEHTAHSLNDPATKALFLDLAHQWRRLARQVEMLDGERGEE